MLTAIPRKKTHKNENKLVHSLHAVTVEPEILARNKYWQIGDLWRNRQYKMCKFFVLLGVPCIRYRYVAFIRCLYIATRFMYVATCFMYVAFIYLNGVVGLTTLKLLSTGLRMLHYLCVRPAIALLRISGCSFSKD